MQLLSPNDPSRARAAALAVLAGIICAVYWPALYGPFLLDDVSNIPQTRLDAFSLEALLNVSFGNESGLFGRPIPVFSFALNHLYGDGGPFGFKLVNLAIHCFNTVLVYWFCRTALQACALKSAVASDRKTMHLAALAAAALWALHPLQVSTVMYAVQRMTLLSAMFSLAALILYTRLRIEQLEHGRFVPSLPPSIVLTTLLACLSKENGALILVHILLIETLMFRFEAASADGRRHFRTAFACCVGLPLTAAAIYFVAQSDTLLSGYAFRDFGIDERLWTQASVMISYLGMILLPKLSEMTFYHDGFEIVREVGPGVVGHAAIVLGACLLIPVLARRAPVIALGLGIYFVSHLLESTFLPLEIAFEHRNYFGIVGFALPLGWYAARTVPTSRTRIGTAAIACVVLLVLTMQTHARALEWSSSVALHTIAVENSADSRRARMNLAFVLAERGDLDGALGALEEMDRRWPQDALAPLLLVHVQALFGVLDRERLEAAERRLRSGTLNEFTPLLLARMRTDQRGGLIAALDARQLERLYDAALSGSDLRTKPHNEAMLHMLHAELLDETDRAAEAFEALETANSTAPEIVEVRLRLAERLVALGELRRASTLLLDLETGLSEEDRGRAKRIETLAKRSHSVESAVVHHGRR